ncbi:MAG: hypothetical protein ACYDDO_02080 [Acidiferrobacterales bacterium]
MSPGTLLTAVSSLLAAGGPESSYLELANAAESLTDMIGWASGPVDPGGKLDDKLALMQQELRTRYDVSADTALATLHDALGGLREAVITHDQDLDGNASGALYDEDEGN